MLPGWLRKQFIHWRRHPYEIIEQYREALEQGVITSVTEGQVRVRYLPIKANE